MAKLKFSGGAAMINFAVNNEASTDATSNGHIKNTVIQLPFSLNGFCKRGYIRVVVYHNFLSCFLLKPVSEWKIGPPWYLVRSSDHSSFPIHRSAKPDSDYFN